MLEENYFYREKAILEENEKLREENVQHLQ